MTHNIDTAPKTGPIHALANEGQGGTPSPATLIHHPQTPGPGGVLKGLAILAPCSTRGFRDVHRAGQAGH